ncbi:MAG TPA: type VI secretion system baseplate subunit TssE, partial [Gemmatimonadales bacterium]|nr:type VI secretion system baseplate subunit TssE [Gemmatimonadales bacterium]
MQQSLLDRLIDLEPKNSSEAPPAWSESVRQLKNSLRHDLEWLLNTRRNPAAAPESFEELRRSLYNFGFPDITSLGRDSREVRVRLLREVEETIATFEPRLAGVKVSLAEVGEGGNRQLRFLIEGLLRMEPNP